MRSLLVFALASLALSSAACSISDPFEKLNEEQFTRGESDKLRFQYSSSTCKNLIGACRLDRPALQGSQTDFVVTSGSDTKAAYHARLVGSGATIKSQSFDCRCQGKERNRTVRPSETCLADESKECHLDLSLDANAAGDLKIEVLDPSEAVVDRVGFAVKTAKRIEVAVTDDDSHTLAQVDGVYKLGVGQKARVRATAFDDGGAELVFSQHGIQHEYDHGILAPSDGFLESTETEVVTARKAGDATMTLRAAGAEATARFRVAP